MKTILIGIAGPAGVGKTSLARAISKYACSHHTTLSTSLVAGIFSLADSLKDECSEATGIPRSHFDDPVYKEALRPLMQWWGTEFRRNSFLGGNDGYWRQLFLGKVHEFKRLYDNAKLADTIVAFCPDVRFDDEAVMVLSAEKHGFMIKLEGTGFVGTTHTNHASEAGINPILFTHTYVTSHEIGITDLDRIAKEFYEDALKPIISR